VSKVIAIANQKGGVGKTTTSINLSAALSVHERSVLLVDVDPQSNATSGLGLDPRTLDRTLYNCLIDCRNIADVLSSTNVKGLSIIPASSDLIGAEVELVSLDGREYLLKNCLDAVRNHYDFIILDCPPALGLLTLNALVAASSVLIPVQCEYYAMEGLGRLMSTVKRVQDSLNPGLQLEGILLTMYDSRNSLAHQVDEEIRSHFHEKVYKTIIPRNVTLAEAPSYGRPGVLYNPTSTGAQAYLELAKEILSHGEESARQGT
jgi:chromosome partitioning protein